MNPAIHAAIIASQKHEESVEAKLRKAGALGAAQATEFEPSSDAERKQLDAAITDGLVRRDAAGRYYLNPRAIADRRESQGMMTLIVLLIGASVIASGAALLLIASP